MVCQSLDALTGSSCALPARACPWPTLRTHIVLCWRAGLHPFYGSARAAHPSRPCLLSHSQTHTQFPLTHAVCAHPLCCLPCVCMPSAYIRLLPRPLLQGLGNPPQPPAPPGTGATPATSKGLPKSARTLSSGGPLSAAAVEAARGACVPQATWAGCCTCCLCRAECVCMCVCVRVCVCVCVCVFVCVILCVSL